MRKHRKWRCFPPWGFRLITSFICFWFASSLAIVAHELSSRPVGVLQNAAGLISMPMVHAAYRRRATLAAAKFRSAFLGAGFHERGAWHSTLIGGGVVLVALFTILGEFRKTSANQVRPFQTVPARSYILPRG